MEIKFTTINVDDMQITREFNSIDEMRVDWNSEDGTTLPSLDDELIEATINNSEKQVVLKGGTFEDLAKIIDLDGLKEKYKKMRSVATDLASDADTLCGCIKDEPSGCEGCYMFNTNDDDEVDCDFMHHMNAYNECN